MTTKPQTVNELTIIDNNLMKSIHVHIVNRDGDKIHKKLNECLLNGYQPIFFEAKQFNIYDEYMVMKRFIDERGFKSNYEEGRFKTLEYMINCIIADPINGDYYNKENNDLIKKGGELLASEDAMTDDLVWSFIPKRFQRDIDMLWDGIGGWMS